MGTPDFAAHVLQEMIHAGVQVVCAVTQPDKPKGRSGALCPSPVKVCAQEAGIPVFQPERIRRPEAVEELKKYEADLFVVAAFGQILSKEVLDMPRLGCVNLHASLLPRYRGAAPIQWSILNGDKVTGITLMKMDEGLDTGDILCVKEVPIESVDTGDSLFDKMSVAASELLLESLPKLEKGELRGIPQDHDKATHVGRLSKEMGLIDWQKPAAVIDCQIRGLNSWPGAYTVLNGKILKIWTAEPAEDTRMTRQFIMPGTLLPDTSDSKNPKLYVQTGEGLILLKEIQLEGKKRMPVDVFLRGYRLEEETILGEIN